MTPEECADALVRELRAQTSQRAQWIIQQYFLAAIAEEREACATIADEKACMGEHMNVYDKRALDIAAAIRARS